MSEINTFHNVCKSKISFTELNEFIRHIHECQFNFVKLYTEKHQRLSVSVLMSLVILGQWYCKLVSKHRNSLREAVNPCSNQEIHVKASEHGFYLTKPILAHLH